MQNSLQLHAIPILSDNYVWTMIENHNALIVDPGEAAPVIDFLTQHHLKLQGILITHHHWDHTNGIEPLVKQYNVEVIGPQHDQIATLTKPMQPEEVAHINGFPAFKVMDIGGHTRGHIAYYGNNMLFCGDTLFAAGCGRVFEGTAKQMYQSLQKLANLPEETKVCCAHEYTLKNLEFAGTVEPSNQAIQQRKAKVAALRERGQPSLPGTLKEEWETNPFLRCDRAEIKKNVEKFAGKTLENEIEVFTWLRKWKDEF